MKYNSQTGRGDWVVADTSLYQPSNTPYGASWNGVDYAAPTKDAVYDKIETLILGGGATAWDDVGDPDADTTIAMGGYESILTSTLDEAAHYVLKLDNTDADLTNETTLLGLEFTDDASDNGVFIKALDNNGDLVWKLGVNGRMTIGPGATDYILPTARGNANEVLMDNGAGAVAFTALADANVQDDLTITNTTSVTSPVITANDNDGVDDENVLVVGDANDLDNAIIYGKLGIGTAAPQFNIHIIGVDAADAAIMIGSDAGDNAVLRYRNGANSKWYVGNNAANDEYQIATGTSFATAVLTILQDGKVGIGDTTPSTALEVNGTVTATGITSTGVIDFGGATSLKIPNAAGDVTADTTGEIAIDSTQKQFVWFDGVRENAIPSDKKITAIVMAGDWDLDSDKWLWEFDSTIYPDGIVITKWTVDANVADPDPELDCNLRYSDGLSAGVFPGANEVLVDVLDTTTGNSSEATMASSDLGSGVIPAGKILYLDLDADPTSDTTFYVVQIYFYIPES